MNNPLQIPLTLPRMARRRFSLTRLESVLIPMLFTFSATLIVIQVETALFNTLLIVLFVTLVGVWLCHRTWHSLSDPKLRVLGSFWLIKLAVVLTLLFAGWIPGLDIASALSGYDPQRYFYNSLDLINNGWIPVGGLNYQGIVYYYAVIFFLFGHNPVIPALINAFVTLLATLFLIRYAYVASTPFRSPKYWNIAWLLLIPEVFWYDVMTCKETLIAVLLIVTTLTASHYLVGIKGSKKMKPFILFGTSAIGILAVRTTMIFPVVIMIMITMLIMKSRGSKQLFIKSTLIVLVIGMLTIGPYIQKKMGGSEVNYVRILETIQSYEKNVASKKEWSDNSIGLLLAPDNLWETLAYLPPRMVLYLLAPLPNIAVSISDLLAGEYWAWQRLLTALTSVLILLGFPYVLAGSVVTWRNRKRYPAGVMIPLSFWVSFAVVAGGNIIIHERYRIMVTLLLFACMWLGCTKCRLSLVKRLAFSWFGMLGGGATFYLIYKFI